MDDAAFELIAAPHTPFMGGSPGVGALHLEPVAAQAEHLRAVGVDGVLVAGSTGEGASLTTGERRSLAARWVACGGGLKVMVHVGHNSVAEAVELARHAGEVGAAALCAAPPSWFKIASAEQLVETCAVVAAAAPELPFYYYHIPVLSGVDIPMAGFVGAARERIPSFAGVKFTHDDVEDFSACMRDHGHAVRMLWGIDEALVNGLDAGAHGAVGSTYNFAAPMYRRLLAAHRAGDLELAAQLQANSVRLVDTLAARGYGPAAKTVMKLLGVDCGPTRLPIVPLGAGSETAIRAELESLGFFDWIGP